MVGHPRLRSEDLQQGAEWRYDVSRINELRRVDPFYRLFQPVIQLPGPLQPQALPEGLPEIQRRSRPPGCRGSGCPRSISAGLEFLALFLAPLYVYVCSSAGSAGRAAVGVGAMLATAWLLAAAAGRPGPAAAARRSSGGCPSCWTC